jgi:hypothetical protein
MSLEDNEGTSMLEYAILSEASIELVKVVYSFSVLYCSAVCGGGGSGSAAVAAATAQRPWRRWKWQRRQQQRRQQWKRAAEAQWWWQRSVAVLMQHTNTGFYHGVSTMCPSVT